MPAAPDSSSTSPPQGRIALVGLGGTGCALLPLLATLPLEGITLIDGDHVEAANLPRQPLYGPTDITRPKVAAAAERARHIAPNLWLRKVERFLDAANARQLLEGHTVVADCTDDLHARLLIDRTCGELGIPLVSGAVHGLQVQVATLHVPLGAGPATTTLRSFFPERVGEGQDDCDMRQVPAAVTGIAGALMALRIMALLRCDPRNAGTMELLDLDGGRWMRIAAPSPAQEARPLPDDSGDAVPA